MCLTGTYTYSDTVCRSWPTFVGYGFSDNLVIWILFLFTWFILCPWGFPWSFWCCFREWKIFSQTRPPVAFKWGSVVSGGIKNIFWIWCLLWWDLLTIAPHLHTTSQWKKAISYLAIKIVLLLSVELSIDNSCCFCLVYLVRTTDQSREGLSLLGYLLVLY